MTPRLETPRLILRSYRLDDYAAHAAIWADPRTTALFGAYKFDDENCWVRFQRNWGQWALYGYGYWGVEEKESGRYIGAVGLFQGRRGLDIPYGDAPEAGWVLHPDWHGRGLGPEAVQAMLAWADANIAEPESWCMIGPDNEPSQKIAGRFGYRRGPDSQYRGQRVLTYTRPKGGK
jgi:RimJ/RimL family protein N-acetyltransferase